VTEAVARRSGWHSLPLVSWMLLGVATLYVAIVARNEWITVAPTLGGAAPFVFAAAMTWATPRDRRLIFATWAIVAAGVAHLLVLLLDPQSSSTTPLLADAAHWLNQATWVLESVGVVMIGLALGGIRSAVGWTVFWLGVAVGVIGVGLVTMRAPANIGPFDVLLGTAAQVLPMAWGYLAAAAVDARRRWFAVGGLLMLAYLLSVILLSWFAPPLDTSLQRLKFGVDVVGLLALAALSYGAIQLPSAGNTHESRISE
jgi:hypothetical protein